jgi:hypothetical protein
LSSYGACELGVSLLNSVVRGIMTGNGLGGGVLEASDEDGTTGERIEVGVMEATLPVIRVAGSTPELVSEVPTATGTF